MLNRHLALSLLMALMMAPNLSAKDLDNCPVKLSQNTTVRNATISITVENPPKVRKGTIQLGGTLSIPPETVPLKNGTMEYRVPDNLPLGQYTVTVKLGTLLFSACESLRIAPAPNWEVKLSPFEPKDTYETETVRVPDKKNPEQGSTLKTVHLVLRGSGFIVATPDDNQIVINGEAVPVKWKDWTELPDAAKPAPNQIYGRVISQERIDLFRVPVPQDGIILIAVRQGDKTTEKQGFTIYRWSTGPVAITSAIIAIALALNVLLLVYLFNRTQPKESRYNFLKVLFLDPETSTYSLSKLQFYLWTAAAIFGYSYLTISKMLVQGQSWPDIPGGLPGIIAIGAGTAVGSQLVTNLRGPKGAGSEHPNLGDFVTSGGVAAADRVQMLVWTFLGVGIFCVSVLKHPPGTIQGLDPIPDGMLTMMGLSAAGYLGGKFARKPGPVISEISITPKASDAALASADAPPPAAPPDLTQPVAEAQAIARTFATVPSGAEAAVNVFSAAITAAAQVKTTAEAGALVTKLSDLQSKAEATAKTAADAFSQASAPSDAARAAEISQQAAAALQDLSAAVSSIVSGRMAPPIPGATAPNFIRSIELRGRNLSPEALLEIDGASLPFQMLVRKTDGTGQPEVVMREQENPTLARVLRLSIDPNQLEGADFQLYKGWFGVSDDKTKKTFTLINPDGQRADISFTILSAAGAAPVAGKGGDQ